MRDMWDAEHTCTCGEKMHKKKFVLEGIEVRGWECRKCGEADLHGADAQKVLVLNKLKKGIPVKVGELGESLIIRFPKELAEYYKIEKGESLILKAENDKKIEIDVE
ncbi:MAG: AbrB/MazE/SpoVT family DNA-binding domain-containing protein [Candidatus Aenigmarchaeota archaeon]|nr:AbrB/MazE/SpoVT family DNA-binding domain-containing protein [Candidatus Aenigmarchaeota archaeon]